MKGLEKYYSQLEKDCKRVNNLYILNPDFNLLEQQLSEKKSEIQQNYNNIIQNKPRKRGNLSKGI